MPQLQSQTPVTDLMSLNNSRGTISNTRRREGCRVKIDSKLAVVVFYSTFFCAFRFFHNRSAGGNYNNAGLTKKVSKKFNTQLYTVYVQQTRARMHSITMITCLRRGWYAQYYLACAGEVEKGRQRKRELSLTSEKSTLNGKKKNFPDSEVYFQFFE